MVMVDVKQEFDSLETMIKRYEYLGDKALRSVVSKAVRAGGAEVRKEMRRRVPRDTGNLRKSISTRVKRYAPWNYVAIVGPKTKFIQIFQRAGGTKPIKRWATKYAHLVENKHKTFSRAGLAAAPRAFNAYKKKLGQGLAVAVNKARAIK